MRFESINMPTSPTTRRRTILRLLASHRVHNQAELGALLADAGFHVNQATLSRDLRELGVAKGPEGYVTPGDVSPIAGAPALDAAVGQWLTDATPVQNQLVLQTPPGCAQPLAVAIDRSSLPEIVGTIAGDDTILVICKSSRSAARVADRLLSKTT